MFEIISVKKGQADPLFRALAKQAGAYPTWNFYKYVVDRDGNVVNKYTSVTSPQSSKVVSTIEELL
jgi:glutathione peroxidase